MAQWRRTLGMRKYKRERRGGEKLVLTLGLKCTNKGGGGEGDQGWVIC